MNQDRFVIHCPKHEDHPHKKILLLLNQDSITVYCKQHGWLDIKLTKNGETLNFDGVVAKVSNVKPGTNFNIDSIPVVAIGLFKSKENKKYVKQ